MVAESQHGKRKGKQHKNLTGKEVLFAQAVAAGATYKDAYVAVYQPNSTNPVTHGQLGHRVATRTHVVAEIARIRARAEMKVLLPINERFRYISRVVQTFGEKPNPTAADAMVVVRAISEYNSMAGDHAPTKTELSGPGGAPLQSSVVVDAGPIVRRMGVLERLAALRRERSGIPASREAAVTEIETGPIRVLPTPAEGEIVENPS